MRTAERRSDWSAHGGPDTRGLGRPAAPPKGAAERVRGLVASGEAGRLDGVQRILTRSEARQRSSGAVPGGGIVSGILVGSLRRCAAGVGIGALMELSFVEQRYRAVMAVEAGEWVTAVALRSGVSCRTGYEWLARDRDAGPGG
jgi:hypothetical protein